MSADGISRRELFRKGGLLGGALAVPGLLPAEVAEAATAAKPPVPPKVSLPAGVGLRIGPDIYQSIGVRPIVNARGHLHDPQRLHDAARGARGDGAPPPSTTCTSTSWRRPSARRLATLTGAEWGLVTSGCSAALTHATAACVAGGNPDLHVRIPNLDGLREGRGRSSPSTRATSTTRRCARWACA